MQNEYGVEAPHDYKNPDWKSAGRVHEWKNYISDPLREIWHSFSDEQKAKIAHSADESASQEEWD